MKEEEEVSFSHAEQPTVSRVDVSSTPLRPNKPQPDLRKAHTVKEKSQPMKSDDSPPMGGE